MSRWLERWGKKKQTLQQWQKKSRSFFLFNFHLSLPLSPLLSLSLSLTHSFRFTFCLFSVSLEPSLCLWPNSRREQSRFTLGCRKSEVMKIYMVRGVSPDDSLPGSRRNILRVCSRMYKAVVLKLVFHLFNPYKINLFDFVSCAFSCLMERDGTAVGRGTILHLALSCFVRI